MDECKLIEEPYSNQKGWFKKATGDLEIAKIEDIPPSGAFNRKAIRLRRLAVRQRSTLPRG
jgi:hypothetical protein